MRIDALPLPGAFLVRLERHADSRGFFARTFCTREFSSAGIPSAVVQANVSYNTKQGTVRGMHFQWPPSREGKLVRCVRGSLFDVLLDLRPDSSSYLKHVSVQLDENTQDAVFIPHGVAHGFQTLSDETEVFYQMTDFHAPESAAGFRWDDPLFGIDWPIREGIVISERDAQYPDFDQLCFEAELRKRAESGH